MSLLRGSAEFERRCPQLRTAFAKRTAEVALSKDGEKFWQIHGVGLESAEGVIEKISVEQVFALGPILTVDGIGLYLEDMILVTPDGAAVLTRGLPYRSSEIEALALTHQIVTLEAQVCNTEPSLRSCFLGRHNTRRAHGSFKAPVEFLKRTGTQELFCCIKSLLN